jgi:hypothetical protein
MIEFESKKKFIIDFKENREIRAKSRILNISICPGNSHLIISTETDLFMIYSFNDFFSIKKMSSKSKYEKVKIEIENYLKDIKRKNKNKNNLTSELIFELNPSADESITMAFCLNNTITKVFLLKNHFLGIEHEEKSNCKFIQWENDFLICAFENRTINIIKNLYIFKTIKDDDNMTSMKIIHFQDFKLLVAGYNKKVKIINFNTILNYDIGIQSYLIQKLEGKIDIIEFLNQIILFCSKKNKAIYCYRFINNSIKPSLFNIIKNFNNVQEIVNVKLVLNEGIIVSCRNSIFIYFIKNNKVEYDSMISSYEDIIFCSVINHRKTNFLLYALNKKIKIYEIKFNEQELNFDSFDNDPEKNRELISTYINTLSNRKNDFIIKKIEDYAIQVEFEDDVILKIEFFIENLSYKFTILQYNEFHMKTILEKEIEKMNDRENYNDNLEYLESIKEKLLKLNKIIKSFDLYDSHSEEMVEITKIKKEQFLEFYKVLKTWQTIMKNKAPINNLFKEEEYELDNKIMTVPLRKIVEWDFSFEKISIDKAFDFVNDNFNDYSSSTLFLNPKDSGKLANPLYGRVKPKKMNSARKKSLCMSESYNSKKYNCNEKTIQEEDSKKNESDENSKNDSKNTSIDNIYIEEQNENIKLNMKCKLTKETFIAYTVEINVKEYDYSKTIVLYDLLGQINSFLQQIIDQKLSSLIELNRNFILDIFDILESHSEFAFLFICILPFSSIIWNEINRDFIRKVPLINKCRFNSRDYVQEARINSETYIKPKQNISDFLSNSESNDGNENQNSFDDFILNAEETKNEDFKIYYNYINEYKIDNKLTYRSSTNLNNDNNINYKKKFGRISEDLTKSQRRIHKFNKSNISFLSLSNKNDKNLIEILGANFCNVIIDYVIFFSEELNLLNNDLADKSVINFFILVNKYYETPEIKDIIDATIKEIK